MDEVQSFIEENQHQLGYIMDEASRRWIKNDPIGALTVGDCNVYIQRHGNYHEVLKRMERYEKALKEIEQYRIAVFASTDMKDIARKALNKDQ